MLTIKKLKKMKPGAIIAEGFGYIEHPWFNDAPHAVEKDGKTTQVKWIAVRGEIHDWAIYHSMDANICPHKYFDCDCHLTASYEQILRIGAKLTSKKYIRTFVPCDDEALGMYRY